MNLKIHNEVEHMLRTSPQAIRDPQKLVYLVQGIFDVKLETGIFNSIYELAQEIDRLTLAKYFGEVWQPNLKKFKHSGLKLVDEVNSLNPRSVLDIGCGYNEFKEKIPNLKDAATTRCLKGVFESSRT